ncbi:MAG TPA: DUF4160 domain-containing protein [Thermoanaerobaculia bacterium]
MPTIRIAGYKFRFYSSDVTEPPHVHVFRGGARAKVWLLPVALAWNRGYGPAELNRVMKLTQWHQSALLEAWNDHFTR